jgi:hypothetical protein
MRAIVFSVQGAPEVIDHEGTLEALQKTVNGFIEAIMLKTPRAALYCNEEGKMRGYWSNPSATSFARTYGFMDVTDYVAGEAILIGVTPDGDSCDLPIDVVKAVMGDDWMEPTSGV